MGLLTLTQAKKQLNIPATNTTLDDEVQLWADATTSAVEKARGQIVDQRQITEEVPVRGGAAIIASVPVVSLVSVVSATDDTEWDVTDLRITKASGVMRALSGAPLQGTLTVTVVAGYPVPPPNFVVAGLIILQHLWETKRGVAEIPRGGAGEVYVPQLGYAVPRRAVEMLGLSLPGVA